MSSGVYCLIIGLKKNQTVSIGKLGKINFKKGIYVYTGSAMNGLEARIERHKKKVKKLFWHIDYFLVNKNAKILQTFSMKTDERKECNLNSIIASLPGAKPVNHFGCSDCKCESHLTFFTEESMMRMLAGMFSKKL